MKKINRWALVLTALATQSFIPQEIFTQKYLSEKYGLALLDAGIVEPGENFNNLISIDPNNSEKINKWKKDNKGNNKQVLVVTWKSKKSYDEFYKDKKKTSEQEDRVTWVTVAPQVQNFCKEYWRKNPEASLEQLTARLKQYLGLDPSWNYDVFVEMWVSPEDIFRPCVNPSIETQQCDIDFAKNKDISKEQHAPKEENNPKVKNIQNYSASK